MMITEVYVKVFGRVQGVFFRQSTKSEAERWGVCGWVKNCDDGTGEALLQGDSESIQRMLDWIQHGPDRAKVENVNVIFEKSCTNSLEAFTILY